MRRSILAVAALAALLVAPACTSCEPERDASGRTVAASGTSGNREARVVIERRREISTTCLRYCNIDACYLSEADTSIHRLRDCLPTGGCCCDCERVHRECRYKEHCENCGTCEH